MAVAGLVVWCDALACKQGRFKLYAHNTFSLQGRSRKVSIGVSGESRAGAEVAISVGIVLSLSDPREIDRPAAMRG